VKKFFVFLLVVWVAGAYISSLSLKGEGRNPRTMLEFSGNSIELFIRSLGWPLRILQSNANSQRAAAYPTASAGTDAPFDLESNPVSRDTAANSVAAVATEEQFSSAMCALTEMPRELRENLRSATRSYLQDRDESKMVLAIEVDEVPFHITRCFERHAARTISTRSSSEDLRHFYEASERALVLTLMLDATSKIVSDQQLKRIGNEARMEIQRRNEKYYL